MRGASNPVIRGAMPRSVRDIGTLGVTIAVGLLCWLSAAEAKTTVGLLLKDGGKDGDDWSSSGGAEVTRDLDSRRRLLQASRDRTLT